MALNIAKVLIGCESLKMDEFDCSGCAAACQVASKMALPESHCLYLVAEVAKDLSGREKLEFTCSWYQNMDILKLDRVCLDMFL